MSFRPIDALYRGRSLRWRPLEGEGIEHLTLTATANVVRAHAVVIGERGGTPYGATYQVVLDPDFATRAFAITTTDGRTLALTKGEDGRWHDNARRTLAALDGCIDIDLAGTPFTNTLPIRRGDWKQGESRTFSMLYVPFDTFEPRVDRQVYTCLNDRLFRYEAAERDFAADLPVDEDGLVTDYPTLFKRV